MNTDIETSCLNYSW